MTRIGVLVFNREDGVLGVILDADIDTMRQNAPSDTRYPVRTYHVKHLPLKHSQRKEKQLWFKEDYHVLSIIES